jgi:hypothetical protein
MGHLPYHCGSKDGKLSPHLRRIKFSVGSKRGSFTMYFGKDPPWCAAEKILYEVSRAAEAPSPRASLSTQARSESSVMTTPPRSEQHHRRESAEEEGLLLRRATNSAHSESTEEQSERSQTHKHIRRFDAIVVYRPNIGRR